MFHVKCHRSDHQARLAPLQLSGDIIAAAIGGSINSSKQWCVLMPLALVIYKVIGFLISVFPDIYIQFFTMSKMRPDQMVLDQMYNHSVIL